MIALPPLQSILHDVFLCVGLGFFTAIFYSVLRFLLCSKWVGCFISDVLTFIVGATVYFALCVQGLATGTVRWYTAGGVLAGHLLCLHVWGAYVPVLRAHCAFLLCAPWRFVHKKVGKCVGFCRKKTQTKHIKKHKNQKKSLPKVYNVLYNSKYEI